MAVFATAMVGFFASPALAYAACVDLGFELEVCGTQDMDVVPNAFGIPVFERTEDQRLTQVFWTAAGEQMSSADDLEIFFWDMWSGVGYRLDARGALNYGRDYASTVDGRSVRGNIFTLRPDNDHTSFFIRLEVFEAHGYPVALEVIEPAFGSNTAATNALVASAMGMVHLQGTGPTQ